MSEENSQQDQKRILDEVQNLREENNILKHKNIELSYKIKRTKKKYNENKEALRTLKSRKVVRIYRKGLRLLGRDLNL